MIIIENLLGYTDYCQSLMGTPRQLRIYSDNDEWECGRGYIRIDILVYSIRHCRVYQTGPYINSRTLACVSRKTVKGSIPLRGSIYMQHQIHIPLIQTSATFYSYEYRNRHVVLIRMRLNMFLHRFIVTGIH